MKLQCGLCNGSGRRPGKKPEGKQCIRCHGSGHIDPEYAAKKLSFYGNELLTWLTVPHAQEAVDALVKGVKELEKYESDRSENSDRQQSHNEGTQPRSEG